jgi:hypothetical protein
MTRIIRSFMAALRYRDYKPRPLTWLAAKRWVMQFEKNDRRLAERLLDKVIYISESRAREILVQQNAALMKRLVAAGLRPKQFIYVSVHDAGSSSPVMLNLLRDAAGLEKMGCRFVDAHDSMRLIKTMNEVGEGALIYVDDFLGTGNQLCGERDFVANIMVGTFSEFVLAPSICEEAIYEISRRGLEAFTGHVHSKAERPLHENSPLFLQGEKDRMELICKGINRVGPLGYKRLATMVVLYRNAPNTVPAILRGSQNQTPIRGIFPRSTDLPVPRVI